MSLKRKLGSRNNFRKGIDLLKKKMLKCLQETTNPKKLESIAQRMVASGVMDSLITTMSFKTQMFDIFQKTNTDAGPLRPRFLILQKTLGQLKYAIENEELEEPKLTESQLSWFITFRTTISGVITCLLDKSDKDKKYTVDRIKLWLEALIENRPWEEFNVSYTGSPEDTIFFELGDEAKTKFIEKKKKEEEEENEEEIKSQQ